jgi:hypothetical protein
MFSGSRTSDLRITPPLTTDLSVLPGHPPNTAARLSGLGLECSDLFLKGELGAHFTEFSPKLRNLLGELGISLADLDANVFVNHRRDAAQSMRPAVRQWVWQVLDLDLALFAGKLEPFGALLA